MLNGLNIDTLGTKRWYKNNQFHREDGPAIIYYNGDQHWYLNGQLHRVDGPAVDDISRLPEWYVNGERIICKDNKHFLRLMNLKVFW
jgi:hypothetical protein